VAAFDDLIPGGKGKAAPGAFDDLIPAQGEKRPAGAFDDLIPERPSLARTIALNNPLAAIGEAGLSLASQAVALPVAGIAGLATEAGRALGLTDRTGADVVQDVAEGLTFSPRGEMGRQAAGIVAAPFEALARAGQLAGGKTLEATGSPLAATVADTAVNALPMLLGPAKKGAAGLRERIAGRSEAAPIEAPARPVAEAAPTEMAQAPLRPPETMPGASNLPREVSEAWRAPETASEAPNGNLAPELPSRASGLAEDPFQAPGAMQPGDGNLRGLPGGRGSEAERIPQAAAQGPDAGLLPGQPRMVSGNALDAQEAAPGGMAGLGERPERLQAPQPDDVPAVADELRTIPGRPGTETQPGALALQEGPGQGLRPRQYDMGDARRLGAPEGQAPARAGADPGGDSGSFRPGEAAPPQAVAPGAVAGTGTDYPGAAVRAAPALDPSAGPLSRAAIKSLPEPKPAGAFDDLIPRGPSPAPELPRGFAALSEPAQAPRRGFNPLPETEPIQPSRIQQMAPGEAYTGFIADNRMPAVDATTVGRAAPLRREDILVPFAKDLGASIYSGRMGKMGQNTLGFFRHGNEEVRIRRHADLETTAHEMAHLVEARVPELSWQWRRDPALREELKAISYDQSKPSEGFAEGVRLWMTQPEELQQRAPRVHEWLNHFAATNERYGPTMMKAREGMLAWFGQDALDRARSKIGDHRPLSEAMDGILDRFRQATVDDLHGVYRMERELSGGKLEPVGAYESARLSRASASIADGAVRYGYPVKNADGSFTYRGKGLQDILKPVAERLDDALLYFVGRSAQELRIQGREHLFTPGEIRGMLGLATPEFRKAFAEYQAWNRGILDFAEAQGVLNPQTRALWKRTEYLPFHRVAQPGGMKGKPGDWAGIQALTGGTENIRDVLGNMLGNAAMLVERAVKNEARVKIADLASRPGGGRFMAKIDAGSKPVKIGGDQVLKALFDKYGIAVVGDAPGFFEFMIHGQPPAGGNVVAVLKAGKPVWYEVADPILYRALAAIDRPPMEWLTKWLAKPKRVGQATITLTPDFMLANVARDTLMGAVMSRSGFRPVLDSIHGMRSRVAEDPAYRDFIANGGGLSSLYLDEGQLRAKLEKFYTRQGIDYRSVLDAPDKLMGFIETLGDAFESSTRLGEYQRAIGRGEHPRHAAYQGREVSTDFAMRGDSKALGFLYDTVMFLRPAVVSFDRLYRGLAHDPNRAAIGAKAALLALASVGLYLMNRDDPRYADLPDWDRDANWHFFIGDQHFRYPKIWEIGALASLAERTTEKLMQANPMGLGKDFARIIANTFSLNLVPQIAAPLVEQATNRNSFTGAPIETPGMENVQPFLRAKPGTSETMKALGMATRDMPESLQVNPARAEALLRGYLNTWGMYGLMLTDRAFFNDKLPQGRTDQLPVVRRFYAQEPAQHTRFEDQFYDMLGEADRLQGTLRALDRMGRPEIADQKELSPLAGEAKPLERAQRHLQGINADMLATRRDQTLMPEEKRQRLDALTVERNQLLKDAVMAAKAAQMR
jgi:conjugative element/phage-associated large polyvalent protein